MATNIVEIEKPKAILLKMFGVMVSKVFKEIQKTYFQTEFKNYLNNKWTEEDVQELVYNIRQETKEIRKTDKMCPKIEKSDKSKEMRIRSIGDYVEWVLKNKKVDNQYFKELQSHVWTDGYDRTDNRALKVPFIAEVSKYLKEWKSQSIELYVVSNGTSDAQEKMLKCSTIGDISKGLEITCMSPRKPYFDKYETTCYIELLRLMDKYGHEVVFFTDSIREAEAAVASGMITIIVKRDDPRFDSNDFIVIHSFSEVKFQ